MKKERRLTPTETVARELFPPHGEPPSTLRTGEAVRQLAKRMQQHGIKVSDDTMKRAIGRR